MRKRVQESRHEIDPGWTETSGWRRSKHRGHTLPSRVGGGAFEAGNQARHVNRIGLGRPWKIARESA